MWAGAPFHTAMPSSTIKLTAPPSFIAKNKDQFCIYDSLLSEEAVLAFEYGYATTSPNVLTIWEAQFGDFANGAQVVIDQFITSGEHKWGRLCGLTLLLPHGYEGQGPEHSSARLERYLQLCAEHNIQVCVPSTPAQVFHMLRRQAIRPMRRPLIVMSPKSLLRHKQAVSSLDDLCEQTFYPVLDEVEDFEKEKVERIVLCSGKVYYDLSAERQKNEHPEKIALIRLEQLYPFPEEELMSVFTAYTQVKKIIWCQEEPTNQGAWYCSSHHMQRIVHAHNKKLSLECVARPASAAAAAGHLARHVQEQEELVQAALYG